MRERRRWRPMNVTDRRNEKNWRISGRSYWRTDIPTPRPRWNGYDVLLVSFYLLVIIIIVIIKLA